MKKIISISVIVLITLSIKFFFRGEKSPEVHTKEPTSVDITTSEIESVKTETIPAKASDVDMKKIKSHLTEEIKDSEYFDNVVDFDLDNTEIFQKFPPTVIYENSKKVVRDLADCLKDFCSMKPDEDGFFDPANTVADKVIAKNLELLIMVSREGNLFEFNVNEIDFEKVFSSQNIKVQRNGLELYLQSYNSTNDIAKLFDYAEKFKDDAKAMFFTSLDDATKQNPDLRNTYLDAINSDLSSAKGLEKVEIIKNIRNYNLDKEEMVHALSSICNEKSQKINDIIDVTLSEIKSSRSLICK